MTTSPTWRWALTWSTTIILLSCVPYIIAIFLAPDGWHFAGILVNPYDGNSYLAKMRQGFDGNWLFYLTYTPEAHRGVFLYTCYLALGHLSALARLPLIVLFHLARLLAGLFLLLTAFRFIKKATPHPREQQFAFIFLATASGLGWLGIFFDAFPIDLWVPEAFVPYSLYTNPHFPLGMALMLIVIQFVVWPYTQVKNNNSPHPSRLSLLIVCPAAIGLALVFPFGLAVTWAVLAGFLAWLSIMQRGLPWKQIWLTLGIVLCSAPVIGYGYWVSRVNPAIAGWAAQNVTPAPAILDLILGFGAIGILAIIGGWFVVRRNQSKHTGEWLVMLWVITSLILVYLPFIDLQRRLIAGLHIPLSILAAIGLIRWLERSALKLRHRRLIANAVVALGVLGTAVVWSIPLLGLLQSPTQSPTSALFFLRDDEFIVFNWLRENTSADDVILSSPRLGLFVPVYTSARSFYGHPFETIEASTKKAAVEAFFRGEVETLSPPPDYIIYGPSERAIGTPKKLEEYPVVFSTWDSLILRVE